MSSNVIVKILVVALLIGGAGLFYHKVKPAGLRASDELPNVGGNDISEQTRAALGIEGDTPADTVKTLISNVREQKALLKRLEADNVELQHANQRLAKMEGNIFQKLQAELASATSNITAQNANELQRNRYEFQGLLDRLRSADTTVNQSVTNGPPAPNVTQPGAIVDSQGTVWIPPLGVATNEVAKGVGGGLPGLQGLAFAQNGATTFTATRKPAAGGAAEPPPAIPAYTIAKNSTLVGATAFTALIGRVPVGENVIDPYSFKVIIGKDNLIANGKTVPELSYAVVSGKAIGDWTLGCVSGNVYSMTFVFDDGRIRTLPKPVDIADGSQTTKDLKIGELSDDFGNPCVVGRKITNASKYLYQRILATAAGAAATAAAAAETTTSVSAIGGLGVSGVTIVDGNKGKFVLDETIAGAANEAAAWIRDRQALEFDAVYVRPGAQVAIHVTEELRIDYEDAGRLTHHAGFALRGTHRALD